MLSRLIVVAEECTFNGSALVRHHVIRQAVAVSDDGEASRDKLIGNTPLRAICFQIASMQRYSRHISGKRVTEIIMHSSVKSRPKTTSIYIYSKLASSSSDPPSR
jgi:hypothetical protein